MSEQRFSQFIAAPPRAVYRALIDPRLIARWRVPTGMHAEVHEFDARPGGRFRVSLTYASRGSRAGPPSAPAVSFGEHVPAVGYHQVSPTDVRWAIARTVQALPGN